jgi:hypothetical protein
MARIRIYLAPRELMRDLFMLDASQLQIVKDNFASYSPVRDFEFDGAGEDGADEAFDLTNNPSRQEEREEKYGRGRSLSVGDVVQVDDEKFVCLSFGWEKL